MSIDNMPAVDKLKQLLKNGYQVIPIGTHGKQTPLVSGHLLPETTYTVHDAGPWVTRFPDANVALVAGKNDVYVLDFDIDNVEIARSLKKLIQKRWPGIPIRSCNNPRFAILFVADKTLLSYTNGRSDGYKHEGELNQIELIGHRIMTIFGTHRKTNKHYRWYKQGPHNTPVHKLPVLNLNNVRNIFKFYSNKQSFLNQVIVCKSTLSKPTQETTFANVRLTKQYSDHELQDLLEHTDPDQYHDWLEMGQALHVHHNKSEEGLLLWDKWSQKSDKYDGLDSCRVKWSGFKVDGGLTLSTIDRKIDRPKKTIAKTPEDELQLAIDNLVYVERSDQIGHLDRSVNESLLPRTHMKNSYANLFVTREVSDGKTKIGKTKTVNVFDIWWRHPDRMRAHAVDYVPMNNRLISPDHWQDSRQMNYYNAYVPPAVKLSTNTDLIYYFVEHMKLLFTDEDKGDGQPTNFQIAMNWFAQIVQKPWERHRVALYSICTQHGMGRGWLVNLTNLLYGTDNVSTIPTMDEIIKPNGKNGYLYRTVLLNVNEVSCSGKDRFKISDRLKTLLSDDKQAIDIKWGEQNYGVQIYTRMFAQANNINDMVIDEDDTRFTVCINRNKPKSKAYYVQLYKLLNKDVYPDFLNQVYTYLKRYKITLDWLQEAPMTQDKITVIKSNKSETALSFYEFKVMLGKHIFTDEMLHDFISTHASLVNEDVMNGALNHNQLNYMMKEQVVCKGRISIQGKVVVVKSFHNHNLKSVGLKKIKASLSVTNQLIKNYFK